MSEFEILSIFLACLALVVSLVVWAGQRRLQREANDLQRVPAELSKRQLQLVEQQEKASSKAELSLSLAAEGRQHRLTIRNLGPADAFDIELRSLGTTTKDSLVRQDEVNAKFPVPRLRPNEDVCLDAAIDLDSPRVFRLCLRWKDADGHQREEEQTVGLQSNHSGA